MKTNSKTGKVLQTAAIIIICVTLLSAAATAIVVVPPVGLNSLNQTPVPVPPQIAIYTKNNLAAIRLGKAFFWDMQVGSDGVTACATCHFHAGADNRLKNQLNPGILAGDTLFGNNNLGVQGFPQFGPNYQLDPVNDFPFHQRQAPADLQTSPVVRHTNDVVSSQGVRLSQFVDIEIGSAVDITTPIADPVFNVGGVNTRRVEPRNTPTVINAVFNFSNFWDGRAGFLFNGENPFGLADPNAGVWFNDPVQGLVKRPVTIEFASLASQAVGPPLSEFEMSARGRTFPQLGRKMLSLVPLGKQLVHPRDSVLGMFSRATLQPDGTYAGNGLNATYSQMIQEAFEDYLWNSDQFVSITLPNGQTAQFTQMEANFSLFWGLAIQLYEATLISDETPFDHWLAGDANALTDPQKQGFLLFNGIANCSVCHIGTEFTTHSVANIAFLDNVNNAIIELMFVSDGTQVIYDEGYTNTAVTPIADDIARGATAPFINPLTGQPYPLAFSHLAELQAQQLLPFETAFLLPIIPSNMPVNANGSFKIPGLRNVELTAPYFHNGGDMTLDDVLDFYSRGGNFPQENIHELDPVIGAGLTLIQGNNDLHIAIVEFLKALTDPRVAAERAPFDHPELFVPEGDPEILRRIPAKDFQGTAAPVSSLTINAVIKLTAVTTQTVSGTVQAGFTPTVTVNTTAVVGPVTVNGINWSAEITGLVQGDNIVTASVTVNNVQTVLTQTITFLDTQPLITSPPLTTATVGQAYIYEVNAIDPFGDPLTFALTNAPAGMTIFKSVGLIVWVPAADQVGQHNVVVRVTDSNGFFDTQSFTVTVNGEIGAQAVTVQKVTVSASGVSATKGPLWNISGTGEPASTIDIFLGPDLTGEQIGSAVVRKNGKWKFKGRVLLTTPLTEAAGISASSSTGGAALNVQLTVASSAKVSTKGARVATEGPLWNIRGTGSPGTTLDIFLGPDLTGEQIGSVVVSPNGKWAFKVRSQVTLPITATSISVSSSAGGVILNQPLVVR